MPSQSLREPDSQWPILNLDQTALLVFPGSGSASIDGLGKNNHHSTRIVQVTTETANSTPQPSKADLIAAFYMAQHEISELVIAILHTHLTQPLPTPFKFVQQEGPAKYILVAESRPWPYGRTLCLFWGEERLVASEMKWTFKFSALNESEQPI